jgi:hypothetical protein
MIFVEAWNRAEGGVDNPRRHSAALKMLHDGPIAKMAGPKTKLWQPHNVARNRIAPIYRLI